MKIHKLSVIIDAAFDDGEDLLTKKALRQVCDSENLDVSEVGDAEGSVIVHDVTEPCCKGRRFWAQIAYTMDVEAESEEAAVEAVEETISWSCEGWTIDQIAVRPISETK